MFEIIRTTPDNDAATGQMNVLWEQEKIGLAHAGLTFSEQAAILAIAATALTGKTVLRQARP
jgi:hypothetical protein